MSGRALDIYLGARARERIAAEGWQSAAIDLLLGASGGPKWLILGHLDRLLFGEFLRAPRATPLRAVGSSVGSWRHACLAQDDPAAAIDRFEDIYVDWAYSERPGPQEISAASSAMLKHILGDAGAARVAHNPRLHSYIVTARGRGPAAASNPALLAAGLGTAALANAVHRALLPGLFQRVVFASEGAPVLPLTDFAAEQVALSERTVAPALHASGSIPFVLAGERDIPGAPPGQYWDGGIIDYHFDPAQLAGDGLILYPHFRGDLTVGWFDKFLPWRRHARPQLEQLILLCPSARFLASLPGGKIPDRGDFTRLQPAERIAYWRVCIDRSRELADDFGAQLAASDPLRGTRSLG